MIQIKCLSFQDDFLTQIQASDDFDSVDITDDVEWVEGQGDEILLRVKPDKLKMFYDYIDRKRIPSQLVPGGPS